MTELWTVHTADLDARALEAARSLLDDAFDGDFSDHDWENALGATASGAMANSAMFCRIRARASESSMESVSSVLTTVVTRCPRPWRRSTGSAAAATLRPGQAGSIRRGRGGVWQDLSAHSLGPIGDALTTLLDAGKADGTIRSDVDARDVIILIGYLSRLDDAERDTRARHLLGVVLDGLRHPTPQVED